MDPFVVLFCWQFILFSLAIAGITYPIRLMVEFFIKSPKVLKFWTDVALPTIPTVLGAVLAGLVSLFPFPDTISALSARVFWGLVAGMFSSIMFRITKAALGSQIQGIFSGNMASSSSVKTEVDPLGRARKPRKPKNG